MGSLKNLVYLTDEQFRELKANGTITVDDKTIEYSENDLYITPAVGGYPVGSIYMSVNNVDPAALFGGSWMEINDRFLLASGSKYPLGLAGGSADAVVVEHNHTLEKLIGSDGGLAGDGFTIQRGYAGNNTTNMADLTENYAISTAGQGESGVGKNMPPYLTVNVWKRIA